MLIIGETVRDVGILVLSSRFFCKYKTYKKIESIFKNSFYGKHLKWFCFPPAKTLLPPFPSGGRPDPAGPELFYREISRKFNSQDIKKHPSKGSGCSGKPGKSLDLKPECGPGQGWRDRGEGCEWGSHGSWPGPRAHAWEGRLEPAFNCQSEWPGVREGLALGSLGT